MYLGYKISVVMATYNGGRYLKEQIESILHQSVKPDEVIICDDCSSDNTMNILDDYTKDKCVHIFRNSENLRYTMNFLQGIKKSSGDIIFLADQDDIWETIKIEEMTDIIINNPQILSLSCNFDLIDSNGARIIGGRHSKAKSDKNLSEISWDHFIKHPANVPGMSLAIKKDLADKIDLECIDKNLAHDWIINEEAAFLKGLYKYNSVLVHYRQHGGNAVGVVVNNTTENLIKNRLKILNGYINIHTFLRSKYSYDGEIRSKMEKLLQLDNERLENLQDKSLVRWVYIYARYMRMLNFVNYCGDLVTIIKSR